MGMRERRERDAERLCGLRLRARVPAPALALCASLSFRLPV